MPPLSQIRELERQLAKEKVRKKEQAKASSEGEARRKLVVCSPWLPYRVRRAADGKLSIDAKPA